MFEDEKKGLDELTFAYFLRFISTITFGIFFSSLSLLMVHGYSLDANEATSIVALFFAFYYALPIIGGKIGDQINDFKRVFITGKVFQLAGSLVLLYAIIDPFYLYFGLALFLADSMVSTVSLNMIITNSFERRDSSNRSNAFLRAHVWSNVGFIVSLILSGLIYKYFQIHTLFYISGCFSVLSIAACYWLINRQPTTKPVLLFKIRKQLSKLAGYMSLSVCFITIVFSYYSLTQEAILISALGMVGFFISKHYYQGTVRERQNISIFVLFMLLSIVFWTIYMLGPTFITLFIDSKLDTSFMGFKIPPQWIEIIEPVMVIGFGFYLCGIFNLVFNKKMLFAFGLSCAFVVAAILTLGMEQSSGGKEFNFWWLVVCYLFLGIGEVLLAPISMSLVGEYIPSRNQGVFTGINQMTMGFSVVLSGFISNYLLIPTLINNKQIVNHSGIFAVILLLCVILIPVGFQIFDKKHRAKDNQIMLSGA